MKKIIKFVIPLTLLVLIAITYLVVFKPINFKQVLANQIDINDITSIKINELENAFSSNEYTVDDKNKIKEVYDQLSKLKVRKCIFTPSSYSIQQYKTYQVFICGVDKTVLISVNTDKQNQYMSQFRVLCKLKN